MCGADLRQHAVAYHQIIVAAQWGVCPSPACGVCLHHGERLCSMLRLLSCKGLDWSRSDHRLGHGRLRLAGVEVGYAPRSDFPAARSFSKPATTSESGS